MIIVKNRQRIVPINTGLMERYAEQILTILNYEAFDLTIIITNDQTIRRYNRQYRTKDRATDILSFPFYPNLVAGDRIMPIDNEHAILGDLILSAPSILRDAHTYGTTLDERLQVLLVHGICHLLGYDHITDQDYMIMHTLEESILARLKQ